MLVTVFELEIFVAVATSVAVRTLTYIERLALRETQFTSELRIDNNKLSQYRISHIRN